MYLILLLFGVLLVSNLILKVHGKVGASSFDLRDVAGCESGAYNSEFVKTVGGGDELKNFLY